MKPVLDVWEKPRIKRLAELAPKWRPVFIIGAPRTGSTILYQMLTRRFELSYIDNLAALFYRNLLVGECLSEAVYKGKGHHSFTSYNGRTLHGGGHAPSECGDFWYRWLPKDRHFIDGGEIPDTHIREMHDAVYAVVNRFKRPFLFKNLNAGQRMRLIARIAPRAGFIFIKRDPFYTAQSILVARKKNRIPDDEWWSIKPRNYARLNGLAVHEKTVKQVFYLERQITEDLPLFESEKCMTVRYEELCADPCKVIDAIGVRFSLNNRHGAVDGKPPVLSDRLVLPECDAGKLRMVIGELDWRTYGAGKTE